MTVRVEHGDSREVLKAMPDASVHAVVTDPPYSLQTINKRFSKVGRDDKTWSRSGPHQRTAAGFMNQKWDTGETAFDPAFWAEVLRVLKPGGHVVAFGGTRTYHRLACAIEDAGFEIRDQIGWLFGSGFPKSHDVAKGIDRVLGQQGTFGDFKSERDALASANGERIAGHAIHDRPWMHDPEAVDRNARQYEAATDAARRWKGWGTALKPAWESICLARKSLIGTVAANVLAHGTGAINIDACRVPTNGEVVSAGLSDPANRRGVVGSEWQATGDKKKNQEAQAASLERTNSLGRWPANVVTDGSDEVVAAFPERDGMTRGVLNRGATTGRSIGYGSNAGVVSDVAVSGDVGSAARFFYSAQPDRVCDLCAAPIAELRSSTESIQTESSALFDAADSLRQGNAATPNLKNENARSAARDFSACHPPSSDSAQSDARHPPLERIAQNVRAAATLCGSCVTVIAQNLAEVRLTGSAAPLRFNRSIDAFKETILSRSLASYVAGRESTDIILTTMNLKELFGCAFHAIAEHINSVKNAASENTGSASKRLWYSAKANAADRLGSKHPTVKPVDLMAWLVKLVTPPGGTVLDPFAGSGTTGMACMREGFDCVLVEREAAYVADIRRRLDHVLGLDTPLFGGAP